MILPSVRGYVLAGGESLRMQRTGFPRDKALLVWRGHTLLQRSISTLSEVCESSRVLCGSTVRCTCLGVGAGGVLDRTLRAGPLGGLEAALADAHAAAVAWVLLIPVDLPCLTPEVLLSFGLAALTSGSVVACMQQNRITQPLPTLVSTRALPLVQNRLLAGERRLLPALQDIAQQLSPNHNMFVFAADTLPGAHDDNHWFRNVNTPEDFSELQRSQQ